MAFMRFDSLKSEVHVFAVKILGILNMLGIYITKSRGECITLAISSWINYHRRLDFDGFRFKFLIAQNLKQINQINAYISYQLKSHVLILFKAVFIDIRNSIKLRFNMSFKLSFVVASLHVSPMIILILSKLPFI